MPRQKGTNTERVQAVLNRKYYREGVALDTRDILQSEDATKWADRVLVTEGLIALREKLDNGWVMPDVPDEVTISANIVSMLGSLKQAIDMLANLDIEKLRQIDGFDEEAFQTLQAEGLKKSGARLMTDETKFETEEW